MLGLAIVMLAAAALGLLADSSGTHRGDGVSRKRRVEQLGPGARPVETDTRAALEGTALASLAGPTRADLPVANTRTLPTHDLTLTCFDLYALRQVRLRWTWLDVDAPFRLLLPITVLAIRVDRTWPHVIVKRAGRGDTIARRTLDDPRSVLEDPTILLARAGLRLQELKAVAISPPTTIDRRALTVDLPTGWRAWGPPAPDERVRRLALALVGDGAFAPDREIVIEVLGPMLIAYPATGPTLSYETLIEFEDAILAACARALAATQAHSPRGVEPI